MLVECAYKKSIRPKLVGQKVKDDMTIVIHYANLYIQTDRINVNVSITQKRFNIGSLILFEILEKYANTSKLGNTKILG